jgi:hypothetical protein
LQALNNPKDNQVRFASFVETIIEKEHSDLVSHAATDKSKSSAVFLGSGP